MHEELSRLLAGELDPAAEAALRARIAADPQLAEAWAAMSALPDLLAGLPLEAPPPALMARLRAMVPDDRPRRDALDDAFAELAARPIARFEDLELELADDALDPAPFAPDPREDTIDPEPRAPRFLGAPVRLAATRPAERPQRSRAEARATPVARSRLAMLGLGLAAALAVGVGAGLAVPSEPASLSLASGESIVDGDVRVRAGDLDVRVDGRARITVTPPAERSLAATSADLVVVPWASAPLRSRPATKDGAVTSSRPIARAEPGAPEAAPEQARTLTLLGGMASAAPGSTMVTVRVERGDVVVESDSGPVRVAAGETRSFDFGAPPVIAPVAPPSADQPDTVRPGTPNARVDEALARRDLPFDVSTRPLSKVVVALETTPTEWPSEIDDQWLPDQVEALLWDVETAVPSAAVADLDCEEYPCVAVYAALDADPAWMEDVRAALRDRFPTRVAFVELSPAADGGTLAVAVGPVEVPALRLRLDRRLHDAMDHARGEIDP